MFPILNDLLATHKNKITNMLRMLCDDSVYSEPCVAGGQQNSSSRTVLPSLEAADRTAAPRCSGPAQDQGSQVVQVGVVGSWPP